MGPLLLAAALAFSTPAATPQQTSITQQAATITDADRDGLDDALEAALLERFRPTFLVSSADCDQLPAEFAPTLPAAFAGSSNVPRVVARNGTIYGQVFRRGPNGGAELIEAHYYHLWTRDCGAHGHDFDAEHVSVLLAASSMAAPAAEWTARTWFAAAHEETVCDVSAYANAAKLNAAERGASVWISAGKHASYLSAESCSGGCGKDRCEAMVALPATPVINLGEPGAPLNGAGWIASPRWPLTRKMRSDFPDAMLAAGAVAPEQPMSQRARRGIIGRSGSVEQHTEDALGTAQQHTGRGVNVGGTKTGHAIGRALGATGRFLGLTQKKENKTQPPSAPASPPR